MAGKKGKSNTQYLEKEGNHYNQTENEKERGKKKLKKIFLKDLVEEITGISRESNYFDAAEQDIKRINSSIRTAIGSEKGKHEIFAKNKAELIDTFKSIYFDPRAKAICKNLGEEKKEKKKKKVIISVDDLDYIIEKILAIKIRHANPKDRINLMKYAMTYKEEEYYSLRNMINEKIKNDMNLVYKLTNYNEKLAYMDTYNALLDENLNSWREEVFKSLHWEMALNEILCENPEYNLQEIINNIPSELEEKTNQRLEERINEYMMIISKGAVE